MLYFVATPIGNLKDISYRAIETLNMVDVIACEDTRNSLKLLNHYNIKKQLIAYHKFNEKNSADGIINLLKQGKNVAVISDSGMPVISDPGYILIDKLIENDIQYTVVPGANASLCALLLSGLDSSNFFFVGFLPDKAKDRKNIIEKIKMIDATLILYISPHSLVEDIEFLYESLGDRKAVLVNEITKLHEKTIRFTLSSVPDLEIKGEYVLVIEGFKDRHFALNDLTIKEHINYYISLGYTEKDAIKQVASDRKIRKNEVYQEHIRKD